MYAWTFLLRGSALGAWKQPLESQDWVFEKMSFLIVIPTNKSRSSDGIELNFVILESMMVFENWSGKY